MQKLVKDAQIVDDSFTLVSKEAAENGIEAGAQDILPLAYFLDNKESAFSTGVKAVWLDSDEGPEPLASDLDKIDLIAINFPKFADGRGYSYARILRDRYGFKGEIRAIGDVLRDQIFYLKRCGFNSFAMAEGQDLEGAIDALSDFSESYQTAVDQPTPLFRRR